jgi:hypothetical protein
VYDATNDERNYATNDERNYDFSYVPEIDVCNDEISF